MQTMTMMKRFLAAGALAGLCVAALAAEPPAPAAPDADARLKAAQERLEAAAKEVAELSMAAGENGRRVVRAMRVGGDGPMLGINIDSGEGRGGAARDGVRVISVSPGGPAASAGLRAGDVITSFNGKALKGGGDTPAAGQLVRLIGETKVGESVPLEYQRDGSTIKTTIKPASLPQVHRNFRIEGMGDLPDLGDLRELRGLAELGGPMAGRMFGLPGRDRAGFGSAELVELSPALGKYFGTDKGLLVVRAPKEAQLKLQDGDVLLDIDGRVPGSVGHAYQILNSYRPGESLKLHIMRQQKRVELQITMPGDKERDKA